MKTIIDIVIVTIGLFLFGSADSIINLIIK